MTHETTILARLTDSARLHDSLADLAPDIAAAADLCVHALEAGGKIIFLGNGGSAADAQHLACELVVKYRFERRALPALALNANTSVLTAAANDLGFEQIFARQIEALAGPKDVVVAISTSGASPNVAAAVKAAGSAGCRVVVMTGSAGKDLAASADAAIVVPSTDTDRIQEAHITIGHVICELVEAASAGERGA